MRGSPPFRAATTPMIGFRSQGGNPTRCPHTFRDLRRFPNQDLPNALQFMQESPCEFRDVGFWVISRGPKLYLKMPETSDLWTSHQEIIKALYVYPVQQHMHTTSTTSKGPPCSSEQPIHALFGAALRTQRILTKDR